MTKHRKQHAPCWPREWAQWPAGRWATFAAAVLLSLIPRGVAFGQDTLDRPLARAAAKPAADEMPGFDLQATIAAIEHHGRRILEIAGMANAEMQAPK